MSGFYRNRHRTTDKIKKTSVFLSHGIILQLFDSMMKCAIILKYAIQSFDSSFSLDAIKRLLI